MIFEILFSVVCTIIVTKEIIFYIIKNKVGFCPYCGCGILEDENEEDKGAIGFDLK
jgi:hypothetical protein